MITKSVDVDNIIGKDTEEDKEIGTAKSLAANHNVQFYEDLFIT